MVIEAICIAFLIFSFIYMLAYMGLLKEIFYSLDKRRLEYLTKDNINYLLEKVAKKLKRRKTSPCNIILVGDAALVLNYHFKKISWNVYGYYFADSDVQKCIEEVIKKLHWQKGWVYDFSKSLDYTPEIVKYTEDYKTYSDILQVKTIKAEYLIAMKLVKRDDTNKTLIDIVGILQEERCAGNHITFEKVDRAIKNLYGDWSKVVDFTQEDIAVFITNYANCNTNFT